VGLIVEDSATGVQLSRRRYDGWRRTKPEACVRARLVLWLADRKLPDACFLVVANAGECLVDQA
jgi:hypothetical protein